jgi:hypothetical protein
MSVSFSTKDSASSIILVAEFVKGLRLDLFKSRSTYFPSIGPAGNTPLHCIHRHSSFLSPLASVDFDIHTPVRGSHMAASSLVSSSSALPAAEAVVILSFYYYYYYYSFYYYYYYFLYFYLYVIWVLLYSDLCRYLYTIQSLHRIMTVHLQFFPPFGGLCCFSIRGSDRFVLIYLYPFYQFCHAPVLRNKGNVSLSTKNHLKGSVHLQL